MQPPIDPTDRTVSELRTAIEDIDDPEALAAILEAERDGDDRATANEAIEERLAAVGAEPAGAGVDSADATAEDAASEPDPLPPAEISAREALSAALRYPWDGGGAGVTLVVGGILTLLSPLIVPGVLVLGYGLRVVEAALDGDDRPPVFGDWQATFVDGLKGAVVLVAYVLVPLAVGTVALAFLAGLVGVRFFSVRPVLPGNPVAGGAAFVLVFLLVGLALVVGYLAPAAMVHLGRTRRLDAAFSVEDVGRLAGADAYASTWLLALAVFAAAGVVLAVLNVATIGVAVSGFVGFYAFVAMAYLYAEGAGEAGYDVEVAAADGTEDGAD